MNAPSATARPMRRSRLVTSTAQPDEPGSRGRTAAASRTLSATMSTRFPASTGAVEGFLSLGVGRDAVGRDIEGVKEAADGRPGSGGRPGRPETMQVHVELPVGEPVGDLVRPVQRERGLADPGGSGHGQYEQCASGRASLVQRGVQRLQCSSRAVKTIRPLGSCCGIDEADAPLPDGIANSAPESSGPASGMRAARARARKSAAAGTSRASASASVSAVRRYGRPFPPFQVADGSYAQPAAGGQFLLSQPGLPPPLAKQETKSGWAHGRPGHFHSAAEAVHRSVSTYERNPAIADIRASGVGLRTAERSGTARGPGQEGTPGGGGEGQAGAGRVSWSRGRRSRCRRGRPRRSCRRCHRCTWPCARCRPRRSHRRCHRCRWPCARSRCRFP